MNTEKKLRKPKKLTVRKSVTYVAESKIQVDAYINHGNIDHKTAKRIGEWFLRASEYMKQQEKGSGHK